MYLTTLQTVYTLFLENVTSDNLLSDIFCVVHTDLPVSCSNNALGNYSNNKPS